MSDGYGPHERARRVAEPPKPSWGRTEFMRDRARVLHSSALRRLAAKTQVVGVGEDDFPRTRLTHSLECAQIGRELGAVLGCDPDVVDAACLAHDLGHPPFGHNGEAALDAAAQGCGGFEGNAQSLRLLTRLEPKVDGAGLNLTRAVLDAATKYPWTRAEAVDGKWGAYDDDADAFAWLRDGAPGRRRCLEAQVMDWADDVAYSVHDLEDGIHAGHVDPRLLDDPAERAELCRLTAELYSAELAPALEPVLDGLLSMPAFRELPGYDGGTRAQAALKRLTSELTGRFAGAALAATREASGGRPLRRYDADLVVPAQARAECALLKGVAARYVMNRAGVAAVQERQREVVHELVIRLGDRAPGVLAPALRPAWEAAVDDATRLRVVVDQVAALTDTSAVAWHARLYHNGRS